LHILNALKPIQGFFDLVGSTHSSDAGSFDEPRDSNRDELRELWRGLVFLLRRLRLGASN